MADTTSHLALPLLAPSQAQKHVTVNEALIRLDGFCQLVLASRSVTNPPATAAEGACYGVPAGAVNAWEGQEGSLALYTNGGWVFAMPERGWRAWIADESQPAVHDGAGWRGGALGLSPHGAGSFLRVVEFDHAVSAGAQSVSAEQIPSGVMVLAATARVLSALGGTASSWSLGTAGAEDRFGSGLGTAAGSYARGMLSQPLTYWGAAQFLLTAAGGDFGAGGMVRIALHYLDVSVPDL